MFHSRIERQGTSVDRFRKSGTRRRASSRLRIAVVGKSVQDLVVAADRVALGAQSVTFEVQHKTYTIEYTGDQITWGEKRTAAKCFATHDLPLHKSICGGGGVNTALHLADMAARLDVNVGVTLVDTGHPSPQVLTEFSREGVCFRYLKRDDSQVNLVLTERGRPNRIVLRSPARSVPLNDSDLVPILKMVSRYCDVLLINSPRSHQLTEVASEAAANVFLPQYSVVNGALPFKDRIELLVRRDRASVLNLAEFCEIADHAGINCKNCSDERTADDQHVGAALSTFVDRFDTGNIIITLGSRGCVVFDREHRECYVVRLKKPACDEVQEHLKSAGHNMNGAGDRWFASFALRAVLNGHNTVTLRNAVTAASIDVLDRLCPGIRLDEFTFHTKSLGLSVSRGPLVAVPKRVQ